MSATLTVEQQKQKQDLLGKRDYERAFSYVPISPCFALPRKAIEPEEPLDLYSMTVYGSDAFLDLTNGTSQHKNITTWTVPDEITFETLTLEQSVFGRSVEHLMPSLKEGVSTRELRKSYTKIQKSCGLPVSFNGNLCDNAKLGPNVQTASFGCNEFPTKLIAETLYDWQERERDLEYVSISMKTEYDPKEKVDDLRDNWKLPLEFVWTHSDHDKSMFARCDISKYTETLEKFEDKDVVNMYILLSKDEKRLVVLNVSRYAVSMHFGFAPSCDAMPILKSAFSEFTQADFYYELKAEKVDEALENCRFHDASNKFF